MAGKEIFGYGINIDKNYNSDFKTPFGPGEEFAIPDIELGPEYTGIKKSWTFASIGIGVKIDPEIGSDRITADWSANGDATGSETVEYNKPDETEDFGPVHACERSPTEEDANIQLSDFKYYFTKCEFALSAYAVLNIGYKKISVDITSPYLDLFTIDMSGITGHAYLGVHSGTTADKVSAMVPVNQPPVADANGPYVGAEGSPITFDASGSTDPDEDTLQYRWDFDNDGAWDTEWLLDIPTASHTWCDDHTGTAEVEVMDERPTQLNDTDTASVTVNNVAPTTDAGQDQTVDEGDTVSFSGDFTDPGCDTWTYEWDFGDDSPVVNGTLTPTHAYCDNGSYTVTLTVTDDDEGEDSDTLTVTVNNVAPTVDAGQDQTVDEGDTVSLSSSFSDPGWCDSHTATIDWGDESPVEPGTVSEENDAATGTVTGSHAYGDDDDYTVTLTVTDDDGDVGIDTLTVTVNNVAPTASIDSMIQPNPQFILPIVHELAFDGSFTDPGWLDTHTSTWDFGDGTVVPETPTEENEKPDATGTTAAEHTYSEPGTYTVTLTVTDDDDGVGTDTMPVIVVDDREALSDINEYIQSLPDGAFKRNPSQQKNAFNNMFTAIDDMLVDMEYQGAIQDLRNNVRGKADGLVDGHLNNDWITDQEAQEHICMKIDDLTAYLEYLKTLEG